MKKTQAEWLALTPEEKAKWKVNPANAEEYLLIENLPAPAPNPPAPAPKEKTEAEKKADFDAAVAAEVARKLAEKDAADATKKAEEDGEYKTLYDGLKPAADANAERLEKLEAMFKEQITAKKALLNDKYKKLDPNHADLEQELKWLETALSEQAVEEGKPPTGGNPGDPPPANDLTEEERLKKAEKALGADKPRRM